MSRRGDWKDLIELAHAAYLVAIGLKEWAIAADMAYELALAYYDHKLYIESKIWADHMEKALSHINTQPTSNELWSRCLDIKGVLLRDAEGNLAEARKCFKKSLDLSRTRIPPMIWRVTTHLGTLERLDEHLDEAVKLYNAALEGASQLVDSAPKLECYQALGEMAISQGRFDDAYEWHMKQLAQAESWRIIHKGRAHTGLAKALINKPQPNIEEAYRQARAALRIEQETTGVKEDEIRILLIQIADKLYEKYYGRFNDA